MMHRRRGVATAGFAFASQLYNAWNFPNGHAAALFSSNLVTYNKKTRLPILEKHRRFKHSIIEIGRSYSNTITIHQHQKSHFRLFGSKSSTGIPGNIMIQDDQTSLLNIDQNRLHATITEIRKHLAASTSEGTNTRNSNEYETYDVSLYLVDDETMQEANHDSRKINKPTDILSFPFHDPVEPGVLEEPLIDASAYYNLGDILIDVPYVMRSRIDDQKYNEEMATGSVSQSDTGDRDKAQNDDDDDEEEDEDVMVNDDRGVSGAMSTVYDPELRINMLLVHGMLHLVGYDHEDDDDYELMVAKEEEILQILQRKGIITLPVSQP
jgi:probable rRNA maturation factor